MLLLHIVIASDSEAIQDLLFLDCHVATLLAIVCVKQFADKIDYAVVAYMRLKPDEA